VTHTRECQNCHREDTRGFTKIGNEFSLRGRTRLAQRLNMRSGPAIWECAPGFGCKTDKRWKNERVYYTNVNGERAHVRVRREVAA
jgi:hypothetical protein